MTRNKFHPNDGYVSSVKPTKDIEHPSFERINVDKMTLLHEIVLFIGD